ncbi:uncharacterized protein [Cherax quadricarinatus]
MAESLEDKILHSSNGRPEYTCWRPSSLYSLSVTELDYEEVHDIQRTVHLEDFQDIIKNSTMIPHSLTELSHTHLIKILPDVQGLWYSSSRPDKGQNNWYGNVSLQVNFRQFLQMLKSYNIYFSEITDYNSTSASRLLITNKNLPLPSYDPSKLGGPWYYDGKKDWFLTECRRYDGRCNFNGHNVELLLSLSDTQYASLLYESKIVAVNHSEANSTEKHKCKKHRSGTRWTTCPSPYSAEKTSEILSYLNEDTLSICIL